MLNWIITSSLLIVIVIALRAVLKDRVRPRLRYGLWLLVLLRLLIPLSLPSQISILSLLPQDSGQALTEPLDYVAYDPQSLPDLAPPEPDQQLSKEQQQVQYQQALAEYRQTMLEAKAETGIPITGNTILYAVWLVGMLITGFTLLGCNLRFAKQLKTSARQVVTPGCHLPTYSSPVIATPCLFGLFRPAIYFTAEIANRMDLTQYALTHELAHYQHKDHLWSFLRCICLIVHWYNPLVWIAAVLSKQDAELCCDETAIKFLGEHQRQAYGKALIDMSCVKKDVKSLLITATTMIGSKKALKERIQLIAKHPKTALFTLIVVILVAVIAVGCTFTGNAREQPTEPSAQAAESGASTDTSAPDAAIVPEPTGYPEGQIPAAMVRLNGILYVHDVTDSPTGALPEGYESAGIVRHEYSYDFPMDERNAAHLEIGTQLYKNGKDPTYIYYWRYPQDRHLPQRMIQYDLCEYPIDYTGTPEPDKDYSIPESYTKWRLQSCRVMVNNLIYTPGEEPQQFSELPADVLLYGTVTNSEEHPGKNLEGYDVPTGSQVYIDSRLSYAQIYCQMPTTSGYTIVKMTPYILTNTPTLEAFDPPVITQLPSGYDLDTLVNPYMEHSGQWTDQQGQSHTYSYAIPEIYPFSADAISVQAYIHYQFGMQIVNGIDSVSDGVWANINDISYQCSLHGDILSVVIIQHTPVDAVLYDTFVFDLDTGKLIDNAVLLEKLGISEQEYLAAARPKAEQAHTDFHNGATDKDNDEFYQQQLAATVADENLNQSQLYLNTDGKPVMILRLFPTAGGAYYQIPITLF